MDAVVVGDLRKTFGGPRGVVALDGISLSIGRGQIYGLLGPNGAGKTTLISILVGLTLADSGMVEVCGFKVPERLCEVRRVVNLVRGFSGVLDKYSARELLTYYQRLYDAPEERVESVLRRLGLWDKRDALVGAFSTGWRQRFFLAKALINKPAVLFMDEPTVGLDMDTALATRNLIRELREEGTTVMLTTHYLQEAEELCDRIGVICQGRLVAEGSLDDLKTQTKGPNLQEVFLAITRTAQGLGG